MDERELLSFVYKFKQLLCEGNNAKLVMDCESGYARVNLEVFLNSVHHPHPQEQQYHHRQAQQMHRRAAGPARLRRRVRRAQVRQAAVQADKEEVRTDVTLPPPNVVEPPNHHHRPLPVAEEAVQPHPPHSVEEAAHQHLPRTVEEAALQHPSSTVEDAAHNHPFHTVENAALFQPPNPVEEAAINPQHLAGEAVQYPHQRVPHAPGGAVHHVMFGRAAEGFPPLSYTPKEVYSPPAAAPLQVSPVWPAHYQEDEVQGDVEASHASLQEPPDHNLPYPLLSTHSPVTQMWRAHCSQQVGQQGELHSDEIKKSKRKKRKSIRKKDESEFDDLIIPGGPGTPTVVMKGWGALSAYGNLTM